LLQRLDPTTAVAFISHATLPFDGLLEYMLADFGVAKPEQTQAQRLFALNDFMTERRRAGQNTLLVLDEAQNLDPRTLEQVRLLSNFETATDKLLQIVLAGQPELTAKLALPELRQLKQRVALRCAIAPLSPEMTRQYIRTRLRIAGARDLTIFSDRAVARMAAYAKGVPRVINILCDHCLVTGYAERQRRIGVPIVDQAIRYLEDGQSGRRRWGILPPRQTGHEQSRALWAAFAVAVGAGLVALAPVAGVDVAGQLTAYAAHVWASMRHLLLG
jgi:type II secretory pathway predicted ATPase ExeA